LSLFAGYQRQLDAIPRQAPQAPARPRGLFGGRGPSAGEVGTFLLRGLDGLDARRAAPQIEAQRQQILSSIQDPRERALFIASPERWAENVGQQFAPQVVNAGASQVVAGRRTIEQPTYSESGDTILERSSQGVNPVFTRTTPSITERIQQQNADTGRFSAESTAQLGQNRLGLDRDRLALDKSQAGFTLGGGQTRFNADGTPVAQVTPMGDPADAARQARASESQSQQIGSVRNAITRANDQIGFWTTGPLSGLAAIGGTPAADLAATLDTIEANLSFQALNEMRANSPTGGALGSITERELQLLGSTVASLRQSQSPQQLRQNLQTIERTLTEIEGRSRQAAQNAPQMGGQQSQSRRAYDAQGNSYVVRNGQWVRE
jgi:hypothetical protein